MEKIINIDTTLIPEKKHTKKADEVKKKAEINAILEKYNLKTPKKSKVLDKKTDFQIKPKPKVEEPIINVIKQQPSKPQLSTRSISPSPPTRPISPLQPKHQQLQQQIQKPTRPISPPSIKKIIQPLIEQPKKQIIPNVSVQNLLDKDKKLIEIKKYEMPKAIISKNDANDFFNNNNMYKIIPTRAEALALPCYKEILESTKQSGGNIKRININPNASEAEVNSDSNYENFENGNNNGNNNNEYIPERKIIIQPKNPNLNYNKRVSPIANRLYTPNESIMNNTLHNTPHNTNTNELNQLELRRIHLQEQQQKEIAILKHKKSQIVKLHNRKKEIELMKSIDIEKQKLRMIQQKQIELNNIMDKQMNRYIENNNNNNNINNNSINTNHTKTINIGTPAKRIPASLIYNVDAKKTKKNIPSYTENYKVEPKIEKKEEQNAEPKVEPKVESKVEPKEEPNAEIKVDIIINESRVTRNIIENKVARGAEALANKGVRGAEALVAEALALKSPVAEAPLAYYKKKDKKNEILFPSRTELYNTETFTEPLTISLGIQPIFNNIKVNKDKFNIEEKKNVLKSIYDFTSLDKFNDKTLDMIYKILKYDKINLL